MAPPLSPAPPLLHRLNFFPCYEHFVAGPLCELCEAGYAGKSCQQCGSPVVNWLIVSGMLLGYVLLIGLTTYKVCASP